MIIRLGWKNIWRNPVRSVVVITAVVIGVWATIFITAFMNGMTSHYLKSQLETYVGHAALSSKAFLDERTTEFVLPNDSLFKTIELIKNHSQTQALTPITHAEGMIASATNSAGVQIRGIDVATDTLNFTIHEFVIKGSYLQETYKNQIVLGEKLAKKLGVDLRSKVVLSFQQVNGTISSAAFRVSGIVKSPNSMMDELRVYVKQTDLQRVIGDEKAIHEWVITLQDAGKVGLWKSEIQPTLTNSIILETWLERAPELAYIESSMDLYLYIFMGIIVLALILGIINTMLMAILERTRELGMLMAIGMPRTEVFKMILYETVTLSCVGTPLGLLLGWLTVNTVGLYGLDLSAFAEGLAEYGMSSIIYPNLKTEYLIGISGFIFISSVLAAWYPATKAIKLKPLEAIRLH